MTASFLFDTMNCHFFPWDSLDKAVEILFVIGHKDLGPTKCLRLLQDVNTLKLSFPEHMDAN